MPGQKLSTQEKPKNISPHVYIFACLPAATSARPDDDATGLLSLCWDQDIVTLAKHPFAITTLHSSQICMFCLYDLASIMFLHLQKHIMSNLKILS